MGIYRGPGVVNDGLVFGYDTGYPISDNTTNNRFNKGQPATNNTIAANYSWYGDGSNQSFANKGVVEVTDESLKYNGYDTYLWTPGSSLNCYLNGSPELNYSDSSTVWTFSCYVKRDDGAAITSLNVYMYYPSSDGSASGTIVDCGNGWYRVSRTRTGSNEEIQLAGFTSFAAGHKYYLSGVMLTKTNHTVPHIQIQSSRSDTAGLIDLKRTVNIDVSGVSFNSNAQPTFDGTDDVINLPNDLGYSANSVSVFAWYKINGTPGNSYHVICGDTALELSIHSSATYLRNGVSTTSGRHVQNDGNQTLNDGNYHYYGFTFDGSTKTAYIDGVQVGTQSVAGTLTTSFSGRKVGAFSGGYWANGDLPVYKVYDKVLTAAEVQQNYQAYKNRFNT